MITSADNSRVKEAAKLQTKARERRERGLFPAEGRKLFLETPAELREQIYVTPAFEEAEQELLRGCRYEVVEERVFRKMCGTETPQGILTLARMPRYAREDLLGGGRAPLILLLENVRDPGNIGTALRTAEAAGATGVILTEGCADVFQPKVVRSTMGSVFRVPFRTEEDAEESAAWLRGQNVRLYAASLDGSRPHTDAVLTEPAAFMIGNEGNGLSAALQTAADCLIRIPMHGKAESLNAAVAAAVLLFEADRQRRQGG